MAQLQEYRIAPGQRHYMREPGQKRGMTCFTAGQKVKLYPHQAKPFRDKLIPVKQSQEQASQSIQPKQAEFFKKHSGAGKYNVFSATQADVALNEEPMTKAEAEKAVKDLLAGGDVREIFPRDDGPQTPDGDDLDNILGDD